LILQSGKKTQQSSIYLFILSSLPRCQSNDVTVYFTLQQDP
jgi:hypothetical protein